MASNRITIKNVFYTDKQIREFVYEPEHTCPRCKSMIAPNPVFSIAYDKSNGSSYVSILTYCTGCHDVFISRYEVGSHLSQNSTAFVSARLICSEPFHYSKQDFDEKIQQLSPQFCKIFNQALMAESFNLDEIAGLGYRKALEFLIKDFAIHNFPEKSDSIKKLSLCQCINNYVDDERIKILAQRSTWIGNDEAHYLRKQEYHDISDMKAFIKALVYFIGMVLITETASSITPK